MVQTVSYEEYERQKAEIERTAESYAEYEKRIKELAKRLKI
jgi:hypothetical protein